MQEQSAPSLGNRSPLTRSIQPLRQSSLVEATCPHLRHSCRRLAELLGQSGGAGQRNRGAHGARGSPNRVILAPAAPSHRRPPQGRVTAPARLAVIARHGLTVLGFLRRAVPPAPCPAADSPPDWLRAECQLRRGCRGNGPKVRSPDLASQSLDADGNRCNWRSSLWRRRVPRGCGPPALHVGLIRSGRRHSALPHRRAPVALVLVRIRALWGRLRPDLRPPSELRDRFHAARPAPDQEIRLLCRRDGVGRPMFWKAAPFANAGSA